MLNPFESSSTWRPMTIELFGCRHSDVDSTPAATFINERVEVSNLHDCVLVAGPEIEIKLLLPYLTLQILKLRLQS